MVSVVSVGKGDEKEKRTEIPQEYITLVLCVAHF